MASRHPPGGREPTAPDLRDQGRRNRSRSGHASNPSTALGSEKETVQAILRAQQHTPAWTNIPVRRALLKHCAERLPSEIQPHHAAAIAAEFRNAHPGSRYTYLNTVATWLRRTGALQALSGIPRATRPGPSERVVPEAEFEAAMKTGTPTERLLLLLAHDEGLRAGTIARMTRENCDLEKRELRGSTKLGAGYAVPMTARVYEQIAFAWAAAQPGETILGAISFRRKAINHKSVQELVRNAKRSAGIRSSWTLHDLRRGAARRIYERTRDVRKVQRLLSHKNLSTTMWYLGDTGVDIDARDIEPRTPGKEKAS